METVIALAIVTALLGVPIALLAVLDTPWLDHIERLRRTK